MADLKYIGKNILNHDLLVKNGKIIGDHTELIKVTVVSDGGNKYAFEGATTPDFTIDEGKTYRFDQSDSSNLTHPLRFSIVENGTWGGGSAYTTGVVTHGTAGVKGAYTEISVTKVTPNHLYYYCVNHSGMGNDALLLKNDFLNLHKISGSLSSTGSFGRIFAAGDIYATGEVSADSFVSRDGSETISFQDDVAFGSDDSITSIQNITATGNISSSASSTGSFGRINVVDNVSAASFTGIFQGALSGSAQIASNISGAFSVASASISTRLTTEEANVDALQVDSASFSTRITADSSSFSTRVTNLKTDSGSFSTRITADSSSFSTRVTRNEGTGSKILNGQLEFTNITASGNITAEGNISGSATSTGSFGNLRIAGMSVSDVTVFSSSLSARITADSSSFAARDTLSETTSSKILNGELEFTNITGSGHISMSISSTGSFGRVSATTIGGHSPLVIDANLTQSAAIKFDNKVFVNNILTSSIDSKMDLQGRVVLHTGSIVGAFDISTKSGSSENSMRFGKAQNALRISGSGNVSRFVTGSQGEIIDVGFTIVDEDGNRVLSGEGDGIHVDSNNYWYNNRFFGIGNATTKYLSYDDTDIKYRGEVILNTGSFEGDVYIKTNNNNMVIGKSTTGLSVSGSDGVSRFATGSAGEIIDLGFTVTDEEGDVTITNIGDGIHVDSNNYWYTSGHFKIGDANNFIDWNTSNLTVSGAFSGSFSGDGSGLSNVFEGTTPSASISTRLTNLVGGSTSFTTITSSGDVRFQSDLKVDGKLTAQEIHTEIESASIIFTSGSTIFGNSIDDTHTFTGSIFLTGSVSASTFLGDGSKLTGITSFNGSAGTETLFSGSAASTGSFGKGHFDGHVGIGTDKSNSDQYTVLHLDANGADNNLLVKQMLSINGTLQGSLFGFQNAIGFLDSDNSYAYRHITDGIHEWRSNNSEKMRLTSTGFLNIGIVSTGPDTPLHVSEGEVSGITSNTDAMVTFEKAGSVGNNNYLQFLTDNDRDSGIIFGDEDNNNVARINYKHTTDVMSIEHGGTVVSEFTSTMAISGSATSTGSFGRVEVNGTELTPSPITALNNATENELVTVGATTTELDAEANLTFASGKLELSGVTYPNIRVVGSQLGYVLVGDTGATSNFQNYQLVSDGGEFKINRTNDAVSVINSTPFKISSDKVEVLNISGSATSTGSFGMVLGDGSGLTNLPSTPAFPFTGSATISGSFSIDTGDGKVFEVSNETGSLFSVTDVSGVPALETLDDKRTVGRFERPIKTHSTDFTASAALHGGFYNIVGGDLTCSIIHPDTASVAVGTEFEFFVNSTGRGLLFETQSMGTTQIISKGNKVQLDGRGAHATLKKVDNDVYHLRGDLA